MESFVAAFRNNFSSLMTPFFLKKKKTMEPPRHPILSYPIQQNPIQNLGSLFGSF